MPEQADAQAWAWTVFWRADNLEALQSETSARGTDALMAEWGRFFSSLPEGCRILDVGTGNGALARLAVHTALAANRNFEVHGIDAASIDPSRFAPMQADELRLIRFHPRTRMEALPFPDRYFGAVVGQYALEYSETTRSVPELLRVLKHGAPFRFLMHTDEAVLRSRNEKVRVQAERLLDANVFDDLRSLLRAIHSAQTLEGTGHPDEGAVMSSALGKIADFATCLRRLEGEFAGDAEHALVDQVMSAIRQLPDLRLTRSLGAALGRASDLEGMLQAQALRLRNMEAASLSPTRLHALQGRIVEEGARDVHNAQAYAGSAIIGCWLAGERQSMDMPAG
jgi:SAM-dependent methyltransferase